MSGMLWIGGVGAIDTNRVPRSGTVSFDETCFYPPALPTGGFGGASAIDGAGDLWTQNDVGLYMWTPSQLAQSCKSGSPAIVLNLPLFCTIAFDAEGNLWGSTCPWAPGRRVL